ncbi:MAG TPA: ubiquinone biosynthesis regulatory protein kinase UbiB [Chromatiaceae bacterium]|jgi:ubiquinone biosynthesis protein|nr:ubiquinone biosynthesis regulatory protein kinase UbiB [Chromatiaceae bacterium]HIA08624.1 ubiquinone biosynthesis regulatory protein kinase UbiB [Chromatiaceae bacterium]HIB84800.1 ubiquinone biosynthesis regulatory protein kinase UbiB [Chromatiaceae bacterium]HIO14635.1 ubiquinone biosynthesis regulatory protein kinase UbiB [Chromatiales bacterium]HIO54731.1 ubiquinone biosynthesis regulatory protein kinase UbiB [Chromatiales bacterium]
MIRPSIVWRLVHINWVLLKHGLDEVILATHLFRPLRFILYCSPWHWFRGPLAPRGVRIREALEELGPIFVKFGQILSTRRDILPDDLADELAKLQDQVPPFPSDQARALIEQSYGQKLEEVFSIFEPEPLASASVAQVHTACLHDGTEVVVKVLRPNIDKVIRRDIGLMYIIAGLAERYWKEGYRLRPKEVVAEYEHTIHDELDLIREAANASQLKRNFADSDQLYVPEIYWPHTRKNVMVMERINGIPIGNMSALHAARIDMEELSARGVEIFFTQVFRDNFFHADMHPGNIFVSPEGKYLAVDFGIMGTLNPEDQHYLAANFLAFFNRDYRRVAELHVESEWVPAGTRVDEFESAIRTVCEPIFEKPLKDISFGHLLLRLFQTARRFNMEVQPQLVLLQKTLLNIEGLGRQLNPDLDLWKTAKPFLENWTRDQVGPSSWLRRLKKDLPAWSEKLPEIPMLLHTVLEHAANDRLKVEWHSPELERIRKQILHGQRRSRDGLVGAALLISATVMLTGNLLAGSGSGSSSSLLETLSWVFGSAGVLMLLRAGLRPRL